MVLPMPAGRRFSRACSKTYITAMAEGLGARRETSSPCPAFESVRCNYEVGPEFVRPFHRADASNEAISLYVRQGRSRDVRPQPLYDRPAGTGRRVTAGALDRAAPYAEEGSLLFPYAAPSTTGRPDYGRQLSAIVLEDKADGALCISNARIRRRAIG